MNPIKSGNTRVRSGMYPEVAARRWRLRRRGGLGVVEERRGAEHGGDEGEEGERHRQRHRGHRQIQRELRAVEHHAQRHRPRPPSPLPASIPTPLSSMRWCPARSSRSSLRLFHRDARGGRGKGGVVEWKRSGE